MSVKQTSEERVGELLPSLSSQKPLYQGSGFYPAGSEKKLPSGLWKHFERVTERMSLRINQGWWVW